MDIKSIYNLEDIITLIKNSNYPLFKLLFDNYKSLILFDDYDYLFRVSCEYDNINITKYIIFNLPVTDMSSIFQWASYSGHIDVLQFIISNGFIVSDEDKTYSILNASSQHSFDNNHTINYLLSVGSPILPDCNKR